MRPHSSVSTVAGLIVLGLVLVLATATAARAGDVDPDQVKAALKTTTTEESGFIDRVVAMVNADEFPRDLFESCFLWAKKKSHRRFQYFKKALIARAAEAGVSLN